MSNCLSRPLIIQSDLVVRISPIIVTAHYHKCPPALGVRAKLRTISHSLALGGGKNHIWKEVVPYGKRLFIFTTLCNSNNSFSLYFVDGSPQHGTSAIVNSVWLGLSLWHDESYLIKISLYHTPRACQQFLTIRHLLLCLIGQTHNTYTNCCSWWTLNEGMDIKNGL